MSNGQAQPQLSPEQQAALQQDHLVKMLMEDLPRDRARIRRISPGDTKRLRDEFDGTCMSYVQDMLGYQIRIRNWTAEELQAMGRMMSEMHERLALVEDQQEASGVGDAGLEAEEHEKLLKQCGGTKALIELIRHIATALRKGEKVEVTDEQLSVVEAHGVLTDDCLQFLSSYEVDAAEGDEPDEGEEEASGG